jgi:hypothetical protein
MSGKFGLDARYPDKTMINTVESVIPTIEIVTQ